MHDWPYWEVISTSEAQMVWKYQHHHGSKVANKHEFERWVLEQFHALDVGVEFVDYDPYPHLEALLVDVNATGGMKVSALHNKSSFDPYVNLCFRAVHDVDHLQSKSAFGLDGEIEACKRMLGRCRDPHAQQLIFCEIVMQAMVAVHTGTFPIQKFVPFTLPERDQVLLGRWRR